ncbi:MULTISPECIES: competence/damage-inducible protein A [Snodgrassella]|uniref:competence/damage-inducible protein A n=1 Tax=Snodgrassella TaxID=1193515 RepID=UPI000815491A|nr:MULTISPECIES: molybdopterin-binding protein [Snodgrassella]SCB72449.1 Predicted nucleotide-utilizing enzyme [Snodgrassella sp. R-53583]
MQIGIIIVGDEIVNGSRQDSHFVFFRQLLQQHGLYMAWAQYLPDDRAIISRQLVQSFKEKIPVFVTGGIGATPDDHTRQACADALNLPLVPHLEALKTIEVISAEHGDKLDSPAHLQRAKMADFPLGAALIPNPFNNIAGFSIQEHYFLPGFPKMAHPMAQWVLDQYYRQNFFQHKLETKAALVDGIPESRIVPLMEQIEQYWPGIKTFSLPTIREDLPANEQIHQYRLEFGLKAWGKDCAMLPEVWEDAVQKLKQLGATNIILLNKSSEG